MKDTQIFIVGAHGQLGTALCQLYPKAQSADIHKLDITDQESVENYNWADIDVIINAAAYTNVDSAQTNEGRVSCWNVNATAVSNLARVCNMHDMTLVHISTDYVFDGKQQIHSETEPLSPISSYGSSKAAGDIVASLTKKYYILRTSWVIGSGNNFVKTMHALAKRGVEPKVVNDQIGRLTFTKDLARGIKHLLDTGTSYGLYNLSNSGASVSWYDIAQKVYELTDHTPLKVTGVTTSEYYADKTGVAPRPLESTLSLDKIEATGFNPRDWEDALKEYMKEIED